MIESDCQNTEPASASLSCPIRIVGVSDVSIGYGSPEIAALMHDFVEFDDAQCVLLEPHETDRPAVSSANRAYKLIRIPSRYPSQSLPWTRQFIRKSAAMIDKLRPDILIIFGGLMFPVLFALKRRPRTVIYHAYEQISDLPAENLAAHKQLLSTVDLITTPNIRRLIHDCCTLGTWPKAFHEFYNSAEVSYQSEMSVPLKKDRDLSFFWGGSLSRERTFADFFLAPEVASYKFNMFGRISEEKGDDLQTSLSMAQNIEHNGIQPADVFANALMKASFSLCWWNPKNSAGHYHLASNRFFSSINLGTPPICGPHPQCVEIEKNYKCAIVMEDWTQDAFVDALKRAQQIYGTSEYEELLHNCKIANSSGLSWWTQSSGLRSAILNTVSPQEVAA